MATTCVPRLVAMRCTSLPFLLATAAGAQAPELLIERLGDPAQGEAAEITLLALGSGAIAPLQRWFEAGDGKDDRASARLHAVLRVVDLLGPVAAPLAGNLDDLAVRGDALGTLVLDARASLSPFGSGREWHEAFHQTFHDTDDAGEAARMGVHYRHSARSGVGRDLDADAALQLLARNEMFVREVAAEVLATTLHADAVARLGERLRDRTPPAGSDALRHNGFVVPVTDRFALRASDAMIRLAPDDKRCAIAWATRAVVHPHRTTRLDALRQLARFGPDAADGMPELVAVAEQADDALAIEALKVLGMTGDAAAPFVHRIEALAARGGLVARLAGGIVTRLRAAGVPLPAPPPPPADAAVVAAVDAAAKALRDGDDPQVLAFAATLRAHPELGWTALLARVRQERAEVPDAVVRLLVELAPGRPLPERDTLRFAIASMATENWHAPMMSSYSGGEELSPFRAECYGELMAPRDAAVDELVGLLAHQNTAVRLAAARRLQGRAAEIAAAAPAAREAVVSALRGGAGEDVATKCPFELAPGNDHELPCNLGDALKVVIASTLAACAPPPPPAGK